jgi:hypothetical protein
MDADLSNVPREAWETAIDRLRRVGVFADEERKFPEASVLRANLPLFEDKIHLTGLKTGDLTIGEIDRSREGVDFLIFDQQRYGDIHSAVSAWYSEYAERWHSIVSERVRDWIERLEQLKKAMLDWLPAGMSIADLAPTPMNEDLMRRFKVPAAQMPTFEVRRGVDRVMRVQPKGLWIIGANGRIDLTSATASYIMIDNSEPLSGSPDWCFYDSASKWKATKLDKVRFNNMLN